MKSNKRIIDEDSEKLHYLTAKQESSGTLENLKLKKLKESKLKERETKMKMSKETFGLNIGSNDNDDVSIHI